MASLEARLAAGRIHRSKHNGMQVVLFLRSEFSRERLYRQKMKGIKNKAVDDNGEMLKDLVENNMGMEWELATLLGDSMTKSPSAPMSLPGCAPMSLPGCVPMSLTGSSPMSLPGSAPMSCPLSDLSTSSQSPVAPLAGMGGCRKTAVSHPKTSPPTSNITDTLLIFKYILPTQLDKWGTCIGIWGAGLFLNR